MKCPKCGGELIPEDANHWICEKCGGKYLKKESKPKQTSETETKQPDLPQKEFVEDTEKPVKTHKTLKQAIIIVSVMVILAVGVCSFLFFGGNGQYYSVKTGNDYASIDESSWIMLQNGKWWTSSDETKWEYDKCGNKLTFYKNGVNYAEGTLKKGTLTLKLWDFPVAYRTTDAQEKIDNKKYN